MKRIVIGDIHGGYLGLMDLLEKFEYDPKVDEIFCVGDLVDGWPDSLKVVNYFMTNPKAHAILGNHDEWFMKYVDGELRGMDAVGAWTHHGGIATLESFLGHDSSTPVMHTDNHKETISRMPEYQYIKTLPYYMEVEDKDGLSLMVHAGLRPEKTLEQQSRDILVWDRMYVKLIMGARKKPETLELYNFAGYNSIYIGHTPIQYFHGEWEKPMKVGQTWLMDTAAAFKGSISGMDILTGDIKQSEDVCKLYPDHKGRNDMTWNHFMKHHA